MLSAKIYEYICFIDGYAKSLRRNKNHALSKFLEKANEFLAIKGDPEFVIAKELRDNITHHYHGATDIRNLKVFPDSKEFSMFLHQSSGNSLSPLGEEIGTFGILKSRNAEIDSDKFVSWTAKTSGLITRFQQESMILILDHFFPEKRIVTRKVAIDSMLVGHEETRSPLLFKRKL